MKTNNMKNKTSHVKFICFRFRADCNEGSFLDIILKPLAAEGMVLDWYILNAYNST